MSTIGGLGRQRLRMSEPRPVGWGGDSRILAVRQETRSSGWCRGSHTTPVDRPLSVAENNNMAIRRIYNKSLFLYVFHTMTLWDFPGRKLFFAFLFNTNHFSPRGLFLCPRFLVFLGQQWACPRSLYCTCYIRSIYCTAVRIIRTYVQKYVLYVRYVRTEVRIIRTYVRVSFVQLLQYYKV